MQMAAVLLAYLDPCLAKVRCNREVATAVGAVGVASTFKVYSDYADSVLRPFAGKFGCETAAKRGH